MGVTPNWRGTTNPPPKDPESGGTLKPALTGGHPNGGGVGAPHPSLDPQTPPKPSPWGGHPNMGGGGVTGPPQVGGAHGCHPKAPPTRCHHGCQRHSRWPPKEPLEMPPCPRATPAHFGRVGGPHALLVGDALEILGGLGSGRGPRDGDFAGAGDEVTLLGDLDPGTRQLLELHRGLPPPLPRMAPTTFSSTTISTSSSMPSTGFSGAKNQTSGHHQGSGGHRGQITVGGGQ